MDNNTMPISIDKQRAYLVLLLACFLAYANSLSGDFVFDDAMQIVNNTTIRSWDNLFHAFTQSVWSFQTAEAGNSPPLYYRPVFTIYLTIGYKLFGLWPQGWHLLNLGIHAGATILVFNFIQRLTKGETLISLLAALLFALTPVHVETVAWISGIPDALSALFLLPAAIYYIRWREEERKSLLGLSLGFFLLAMFCKETPIVFPAILLAWETTRSKGVDLIDRLLSSIKPVLPLAIPALAYLGMRFAVLGKLSAPHPDTANVPVWSILATVPQVLTAYLAHIIFPYNLSLMYQNRFIIGVGDNLFWVPLLILTAIIIGLYLLRKHITALMCFAIAFFFIPLLPVLNLSVFHHEYIVQDRYLYLPSIGFVLLLAIVIQKLWTSKNPLLKRAAMVAVVILCLGYVGSTILQNRVWRSELTLWSRAKEVDPDSWATRYNLGLALDLEKKHSEALEEFNSALGLPAFDRKDALIYNNRGSAKLSLGDTDGARLDFVKALEINPELTLATANLGIVALNQRNYAEAERLFQKVNKSKPGDPSIEFNLAKTWAGMNRHKEAMEIYEKLLKTETKDSVLLFNAAVSLNRLGQYDRAASLLAEADRLATDDKLKKQISEEKKNLR